MTAILISGTPGTGKSTLGAALSKKLGWNLIDMGRLAEDEHIYAKVDRKRNTKVIDERRLARRVEQEIRKASSKIIVSSHYAEIIHPRFVDKVIVLRTHPAELRNRVEQRGWNLQKVQENMESEILGVCSFNALRRYGKERVYEIDTTRISSDVTLSIALQIIGSGGRSRLIGSIDWLPEIEKDGVLDRYIPKK